MASVKASGYDFKRYWNDSAYWGDAYIEDEVIEVNGDACNGDGFDADSLNDSDVIVVKSGVVISCGLHDSSLTAHLRKWLKALKARNTTTVLIEVDRDKIDSLLAAISPSIVANGGKVVSK